MGDWINAMVEPIERLQQENADLRARVAELEGQLEAATQDWHAERMAALGCAEEARNAVDGARTARRLAERKRDVAQQRVALLEEKVGAWERLALGKQEALDHSRGLTRDARVVANWLKGLLYRVYWRGYKIAADGSDMPDRDWLNAESWPEACP